MNKGDIMINVAVDRKTWYRGKGMAESRLLRPDGQKCCIGFLGIELGACEEDLLDLDAFVDVRVKDIERFNDTHDEVLTKAYVTNDDKNITEAAREEQLIVIGQLMDVNFYFIN